MSSQFKFYAGKKCLVTGGTGLIGREVANLLLEAGSQVKVVSLDKININNNIEHVYGDLTDLSFCTEQTKGIDCVFHCRY